MDPHELPTNQKRAGKLPSQIIKKPQKRTHQKKKRTILKTLFQIK